MISGERLPSALREHRLGMRGRKMITVAEGVETDGQLEAIREFGCSLSQRYLHHAPMPRRELEEVMAEGSRSRTYQEASGAPSRV